MVLGGGDDGDIGQAAGVVAAGGAAVVTGFLGWAGAGFGDPVMFAEFWDHGFIL